MKKLTQKFLFGIVGKIGLVLLIAICLAMFNSTTKAQQTLLVNYDFASAVAGTPCAATPLTTAQNVTSLFTTGGTNGENCTTPTGHSTIWSPDPTVLGGFAYNLDDNLAVNVSSSTIDAANYFQFQLKGVSAYRSYKLFFQYMRSGPIDIQYSTDGNNFTTFSQIPIGGLEPAISYPHKIFDLSSITALDGQPTVYFRLLGKSSLNSGLYFRIDNFQVQAVSTTKSNKRVRIAF